jgi:hypothetical protein
MKEEDLEAGAYASFKSCKLMKSFRREENMFEIYSLNGDSFIVIQFCSCSFEFKVASKGLLLFNSIISLLCENRSFKENCQVVDFVELEFNLFNVMLLVTESGKRPRYCRIIIGDNSCLYREYGYTIHKKTNSQETSCETMSCRVVILASKLSVRERNLEAEAEARFGNVKLNESVQKDQLTFVYSRRSEVLFCIVVHENEIFVSLFRINVPRNSDFSYGSSENSRGSSWFEADVETVLYNCISLSESYVLFDLDVCINLMVKLVMLYGTEGERKFRECRIIRGDKEDSYGRYGSRGTWDVTLMDQVGFKRPGRSPI